MAACTPSLAVESRGSWNSGKQTPMGGVATSAAGVVSSMRGVVSGNSGPFRAISGGAAGLPSALFHSNKPSRTLITPVSAIVPPGDSGQPGAEHLRAGVGHALAAWRRLAFSLNTSSCLSGLRPDRCLTWVRRSSTREGSQVGRCRWSCDVGAVDIGETDQPAAFRFRYMCRGWTAESRERERGGHGFHRPTSFYLDESTRMRSTKPGGGGPRRPPCIYHARMRPTPKPLPATEGAAR